MNIAIWGKGKFGNYIKSQLEEREDISLICFIDRNPQPADGRNDLETIALSEVKSKPIDRILVAIIDYTSIFTQLQQICFQIEDIGLIRKNVYRLKKRLSEDILSDANICWLKGLDIHKPILKTLETNIMDGCNLNCKGCSHFSNLFTKEAHIPFENFCDDLKEISDHAFIAQLNLLGGEALLNERLTDYLDYARMMLPFSEIEIVSNGLLVPQQKETFFECCRKNSICISISGYKPTLLMKEKIRDVLEQNHVDYFFRQDVISFGKNIDLRGEAKPEEAFKRCRESSCHFFRGGKIYKCPFAALGNKFFRHYDLDIRLNSGTDIFEPGLDWDKLIMCLERNPVEACRYCGEEERMEWETENNPKPEDWIISIQDNQE